MFSIPFDSFYPILLFFTTYQTILWISECIWLGCMPFERSFRKKFIFIFISTWKLKNKILFSPIVWLYILRFLTSLPSPMSFFYPSDFNCSNYLLFFVFFLPFEVITKFNLQIHFLLPFTFTRIKMRLKMLFNHRPFRASYQKILT